MTSSLRSLYIQPSIHLSLHLFFLYIYLSIYASINQSIFLCLSISVTFYLSIFIYLSIFLSFYLKYMLFLPFILQLVRVVGRVVWEGGGAVVRGQGWGDGRGYLAELASNYVECIIGLCMYICEYQPVKWWIPITYMYYGANRYQKEKQKICNSTSPSITSFFPWKHILSLFRFYWSFR